MIINVRFLWGVPDNCATTRYCIFIDNYSCNQETGNLRGICLLDSFVQKLAPISITVINIIINITLHYFMEESWTALCDILANHFSLVSWERVIVFYKYGVGKEERDHASTLNVPALILVFLIDFASILCAILLLYFCRSPILGQRSHIIMDNFLWNNIMLISPVGFWSPP